MVKSDIFGKGATEGKKSPCSRRSQVLNKLFMRYITEIMATGKYSTEIIGYGIEVNRVCLINKSFSYKINFNIFC